MCCDQHLIDKHLQGWGVAGGVGRSPLVRTIHGYLRDTLVFITTNPLRWDIRIEDSRQAWWHVLIIL